MRRRSINQAKNGSNSSEPGTTQINKYGLTEEALRILGHGRDVSSIGDLLAALTEADCLKLDAALQGAITGRQSLDIEVEGRRTDGSPMWLRIIGEAGTNRSEGTSLTGTLHNVRSTVEFGSVTSCPHVVQRNFPAL